MSRTEIIRGLSEGPQILYHLRRGELVTALHLTSNMLSYGPPEPVVAAVQEIIAAIPELAADEEVILDFLRPGIKELDRLHGLFFARDRRLRLGAMEEFAHQARGEDFEAFEPYLQDSDEAIRLAASAAMLAALEDPEARSGWIGALLHSANRAEVMQGLKFMSFEDAPDELGHCLSLLLHPDETIREEAARALDRAFVDAAYTLPEDGPAYQQMGSFMKRHARKVSPEALHLLAYSDTERARKLYPLMLGALNSENPLFRSRIVMRLQNEHLLDEPTLRRLTGDASSGVRAYAYEGLLANRTDFDTSMLKRMLAESNTDIRWLALDVIRRADARELLPEVSAAARDSDSRIQSTGKEILKAWGVALRKNDPLAKFRAQPITDLQAFSRALKETEYASLAAPIRKAARPTLAIRELAGEGSAPVGADAGALPRGRSQLGGLPHLPDGEPWPVFEGRPMAFVAQIDLAEIHALDVASRLPSSGLLSFFVDEETASDPPGSGKERVLYFDASRTMQPSSFPADLPEAQRFLARPISFFECISLPHWNSHFANALDADQDLYKALLDELELNQAGDFDRLFGHAVFIQDDFLFDSPGTELLLQVDSKGGMMWGDTGRLYYLISRKSLKSRKFDQVFMELQAY